jgi:hypothetical protein
LVQRLDDFNPSGVGECDIGHCKTPIKRKIDPPC